MKLFLKHLKDRTIFIRSIKIALFVGTILALINHFDAIFNGTFNRTNTLQILLTYLVPYCVATYGSVSHACHIDLEKLKDQQF